jgi:hypothetical protein
MNTYFTHIFMSTLLCASFNNVIAYPAPSTDIRSAVDQKVDVIIYDLNLEGGRDLNATVASIAGILTLFNIAIDRADGTAFWFGICLYNIYRALQKTKALKDLDDIKRIVRNHVDHLHGYVR